MYIDLGNGYSELAKQFPNLSEFQSALLGDFNWRVEANTPDVLFVRLNNGQAVKAKKNYFVPSIPGLPVIIGKERSGSYYIVCVRENSYGSMA